VPEYRLADAHREALPDGRWRTTATLTNRGTGAPAVEVAAVAGERFDDQGKPKDGYRQEKVTVIAGAGASVPIEIVTDFKPERLVVDPDVRQLQLERNAAEEAL
jgi:ABC-2 type transport system permease protein